MKKIERFFINFKLNKGNKLNKKKGAELVESILMVGVAIALIVVVFYPQIMNIMNTGFDSIELWFNNAMNKIGQPGL